MLPKVILPRPKALAGTGVARPVLSAKAPLRQHVTPLTTPSGKVTAGVHPVFTNGVVSGVKNHPGPVKLAPKKTGVINRPSQASGKLIAGSSLKPIPRTPAQLAGSKKPTFGAWLGTKMRLKLTMKKAVQK